MEQDHRSYYLKKLKSVMPDHDGFRALILCLLLCSVFPCAYMCAQDNARAGVETENTREQRPVGNDAAQPDSAKRDSTRTDTSRVEILAIKNNLFYDAIATPNLQVEFRLNDKWSLEANVGFNPFPLDDTKYPKWRHIMVALAPRYWICHTFNRDFVSFNAAYAHYNVGGNAFPVSWMYNQVKTNRYEGDAVMAGLSYGWHWAVSPHFSIELEGGIDGGYTWYKKYKCEHCGDMMGKGGRWFLLPKVGLNLSVPLGGDEYSLARRCDCEKIDGKQDTVVAESSENIGENRIVSEPSELSELSEVAEAPADSPEVVRPAWIPAERIILKPLVAKAKMRRAVVPFFVPQVDQMRRLRNRILRDDSEYEPYDQTMALSADPRNTFIFFDVDVTKMDRSFIENDRLMDSIVQIIGEALRDPEIRITRIQIVGFASFDGRLSYNIGLAGNRAKTIKEYIQSLYHLDDKMFAVENGGESWAELRYQLEKVEFEGKDEVIRIMDTEPDVEKRERLIKALHGGRTYVYMRDELKHILRNLGCITVYCDTNDDYEDSDVSDSSDKSDNSGNSGKPAKRIVHRDWEKQSKKVQH